MLSMIVRFRDTYELISGDKLTNHGFQFLRLAWGKVKEDRILVDVGVVEKALELIETRNTDGAARTAKPRHEPAADTCA